MAVIPTDSYIPVSLSQTNTWEVVDASTIPGLTLPGNANGLFLNIWNTSGSYRRWGAQGGDSTDDIHDNANYRASWWWPVPLGVTNANEFRVYRSSSLIEVYVSAVCTSDESEWTQNYIRFDPTNSNVWETVNVDPGGSFTNTPIAAYVVQTSSSPNAESGYRHPDDTADIRQQYREINSFLCPTNAQSEIGVTRSSSGVRFYTSGINHAHATWATSRSTISLTTTDEENLPSAGIMAHVQAVGIQGTSSRPQFSSRCEDIDFPASVDWPSDFIVCRQQHNSVVKVANGRVKVRTQNTGRIDEAHTYGYFEAGAAPPAFKPAWAANGRRVVQ